MPAYVILVNFTDQGIKNAKDTVKRAKAVEQALGSVGGRKIGIWWTMGQYDMVFLAEGPDDETAMRVLLGTAMQGKVRTTTLKAFSEEEMASIVAGLP
jgi:uncharacterized protein with GYD domain